jgi:signal peptidase II
MLQKALRNAALFFIAWVVVMAIYALTHGVKDMDYLWRFSVLPGLVLGGIAGIATILGSFFPVRKGINWIVLLVLIGLDQGIKIYLFSLEWETLSIPLIEPVFYLEPTQNTLGSYLWVLLKLKKGSHLLNIILFSVLGILFVEGWRFYVAKKRNSFWINGFIHLFLAGLFANIIDNAVWGGSLDYITIKPFFTFDLKDMFITMCELFLLTELMDNKLLVHLFKMPKERSKELNREFYGFVANDFRRLFGRKK